MNKKYRAFSMIEISMVLVLLTAIILGIMQTTTLVNDARLARAQTLTKKSPVKDIKGLILWLETSLEESFIIDEGQDSVNISSWFDIKNNDLANNHATQSNSSNQPTYVENAFNDAIAAVRFDGSNDFLLFDGSKIINSSYTIFIVEKRTDSKSNNYFISGTSTISNSNLLLGYSSNTALSYSHYNNTISNTIGGYNGEVARIHSFKFDYNGKEYFENGGLVANASDINNNALSAFDGSTIGRYLNGTSYYKGDIAEIIIFNRALDDAEKTLVEEYLSNKYGINVG